MISYYCYFGDTNVGKYFKNILFGNLKVVPFFEEKISSVNYGSKINKILLRFFLDGEVTEYTQIEDSSFFYDKSNKAFIFNYRLKKNTLSNMSIIQTLDYIKLTTQKSIQVVQKQTAEKNIPFDTKNSLPGTIEKLFNIINEKNI